MLRLCPARLLPPSLCHHYRLHLNRLLRFRFSLFFFFPSLPLSPRLCFCCCFFFFPLLFLFFSYFCTLGGRHGRQRRSRRGPRAHCGHQESPGTVCVHLQRPPTPKNPVSGQLLLRLAAPTAHQDPNRETSGNHETVLAEQPTQFSGWKLTSVQNPTLFVRRPNFHHRFQKISNSVVLHLLQSHTITS